MDRLKLVGTREATKANRALSLHTNLLRKSSASLLQYQELLNLCFAGLPTALEIYVGRKRRDSTRDQAVLSCFALHHEPLHLLNHDGGRNGKSFYRREKGFSTHAFTTTTTIPDCKKKKMVICFLSQSLKVTHGSRPGNWVWIFQPHIFCFNHKNFFYVPWALSF